ncbi:unnamed protein product [Adineta ricciae]|uniref:Apple domain-containing protein n=1 Tax=Adineta ricciae TaxID=249248 RepID=A0A815QN53_ADIRI|nr:unnamed protein product [Adineta ricciae]CAF1464292.1 unnamed protein product [Adineta ricciae]
MFWFVFILCLVGRFQFVESACSPPIKFYVDCARVRTANAASQFCLSHGMTLVNFTNGTGSLASDVSLLNTTFIADSCVGNFWYSSGSRTGLVASTNELDNLLGALTNLLGSVLCLIPFLCPAVTTAAPILNAYTVCTRPIHQNVIRKCLSGVQREDMQQFRYRTQSMYAGVLDTFSSRTIAACSGSCSSNNACVGISYSNGICTLYM